MSDQPTIYDRKPQVLELDAGTHWWCACGRSAGQPFCDGSHKGTGMSPVKFELAERKSVALCNCKHTGNKPFCDGVHKTLPAS